MVVQRQAGFTLVEVVLALAISGALISIAFRGLSGMQAQARYTSSVDAAKESFLRVRTNALSSINNDPAAGSDVTTLNFGQLMIFTPGSSAVKVYALTTANSDSPANNQPVVADDAAADDFTLRSGLQLIGGGSTDKAVAFTRSLADGSLRSATFNGSPSPASLKYDDFAGTGNGTYRFKNLDGRPATITVNTDDNGITRVFQ